MRLLDLVEEDDAVRVPADPLGQLAAVLVPDVARRRTDQLRDRVLLHVFGHVEAHEGLLALEQELGQPPGDLGLSDARRPEEDERAHRPVGVVDTQAGPPDRLGDADDGRLLSHDAAPQSVLHVKQLLGLLHGEGSDRDAGPGGDDLFDVPPRDLLGRVAPLGSLGLRPLDLFLELDLPLAQEDGLFEVLVRDRLLHLLDDLARLDLELAEVLGVGDALQFDLGARLVQEVDGLVGEEAVGDVAIGLVHRGLDRLGEVADLMELLVPVLDSLEDLECLQLGRGGDLDRLEPSQEAAILFDVLAVLLERRRADAGNLAPREGGFQDVGRVE